MLKRITWVLFNAVAMIATAGIAVWLTLTGHTLQIGGLLLAMAGVVYVLVRGVIAMASGRDVTGEESQKWMQRRVLFQAVAIVIVILILVVAGASSSQ